MATPADEPKDVLDFKFRSIRKVRLHDETAIGEIPKEPTQKLAVANTLGRIFAGKNYLKPMPCLELVSKKLNHFGVIADLFRQIGGHSSRFVLFCSF